MNGLNPTRPHFLVLSVCCLVFGFLAAWIVSRAFWMEPLSAKNRPASARSNPVACDAAPPGAVAPEAPSTVSASRAPTPSPVLADDDSLARALSAARHRIVPVSERERQIEMNRGARFFAANPRQDLTLRFLDDRVRLASGQSGQTWEGELVLLGVTRDVESGPEPGGGVAVSADESRVKFLRRDLTEWYVNAPAGFEHGFTLFKSPPGAETSSSFTVTMKLEGLTATPSDTDDGGLTLSTPAGAPVASYSHLVVADAMGRRLPAHLESAPDRIRIVVADAGAVYPVTIDPLIGSLEQRLGFPAGDAQPGEKFGASVSLSGDTAAIGAPYDAHALGADAGSVYVFTRPSSGVWSFRTKLYSQAADQPLYFGARVAISGTTIAAAGYGHTILGKVYVFAGAGATWTEDAQLPVNASALALEGDTLLVGAASRDTTRGYSAGAAFVFARSGQTWTQLAQLEAGDGAAQDYFGGAVALQGDTAVVGAIGHDFADYRTDAGSVYVFARSGTAWTQQAALAAPVPAAYERFGESVALGGGRILAGSPNRNKVHAFAQNGSAWIHEATLQPTNPGSLPGLFGAAVALAGNTALITDPYRGLCERFSHATGAWLAAPALVPSDPLVQRPSFGSALAFDGTTALIGFPGADLPTVSQAGAVSVFRQTGGTWTQEALLAPAGGANSDGLGSSVALSGDTLIAGTPTADTPAGNEAGRAFVFVRSGAIWSEQAALIPAGGAAGDHFGQAVAVSGNTALVGAPNSYSRWRRSCLHALRFDVDGTGQARRRCLRRLRWLWCRRGDRRPDRDHRRAASQPRSLPPGRCGLRLSALRSDLGARDHPDGVGPRILRGAGFGRRPFRRSRCARRALRQRWCRTKWCRLRLPSQWWCLDAANKAHRLRRTIW